MKNAPRLLTYATLSLIFLGCGGTGGNTTSAGLLWQGRWSGNIQVPTNGELGTLTINVGSNGAVNGSGTNATLAQNFNVAGFIHDDSSVTWTISGDRSGTITGSITKASNGHMTGILSEQDGSKPPMNITLDLIPQ